MTYIKWTFWGLILLILAAFLHYTLPQRDVVRITDTYSRITPIKYPLFWSGDAPTPENSMGRDVFMIETRYPNGKPMIFRNEDTDWGWPPYFKFDTTNLQADASEMVSTKDNPKWVAVRHYGWRNEFLTIFPNAISIHEVDGPDVRLIPWFNIILIVSVIAIFWAIRVRWNRFWSRRSGRDDKKSSDGWT